MRTTITPHNIRRFLFRAILIIQVFATAGQDAAAQADAQFSQYFEVPNYYNAAAIGTTDLLRIRGGARLQWVGIENAPKTFLGAADMPFKIFGKRFGVGLVMQQESLGLFKNMTVGAQVAYKQKLFKGTLSIGAQIGFIDQSFKGSEVYIPDDDDYHQSTDDAIPKQDIRGNAFDVGAGILYTHKWFWAGISGTHLNSPSMKMNAESGENGNEKNYEFQMGRTLYFMAGSNIPIKNTLIELQPAIIAATDLTDFTGIVEMRARYNRFISVGIGYRYLSGISLSLGAEYKNFFLGYSYEYPLSAIAKASAGSHEIVAGYQLKLDFSAKNRNRHRSIRIM